MVAPPRPKVSEQLRSDRELPQWEQGMPITWRPAWEVYRRHALLDTEGSASPARLQNYGTAYKQLAEFVLPEETTPETVTKLQVELFIADLRDRGMSKSTINARFRALRAIFNDLVEAGVLAASPMTGLKAPKVKGTKRGRRPVSPTEQQALLDACVPDSHAKGKKFEAHFRAVRDRAMISFLIDTGSRVGGILSMSVYGTNLAERWAMVILKDGSIGPVVFGSAAAKDLAAYLEVRSQHQYADLPNLWLGERGGLGKSGLARSVKVRAEMAHGVDPNLIWPHAFRYADANHFAGLVSDTTTMNVLHWRDRRMLSQYSEWGASGRARDAMDEYSPRDRLS